MVIYTTYLWWNWGWFIVYGIVLPTLHHSWDDSRDVNMRVPGWQRAALSARRRSHSQVSWWGWWHSGNTPWLLKSERKRTLLLWCVSLLFGNRCVNLIIFDKGLQGVSISNISRTWHSNMSTVDIRLPSSLMTHPPSDGSFLSPPGMPKQKAFAKESKHCLFSGPYIRLLSCRSLNQFESG